MLFVDFSSAFNTIIPQHLVRKLRPLGLGTPLCNWLMDFLTEIPHFWGLEITPPVSSLWAPAPLRAVSWAHYCLLWWPLTAMPGSVQTMLWSMWMTRQCWASFWMTTNRPMGRSWDSLWTGAIQITCSWMSERRSLLISGKSSTGTHHLSSMTLRWK